jgi:hypothetical protein
MTATDEPREETPVLDLLTQFWVTSLEASDLDAVTLMQARIAALVAVDASPASYLLHLRPASAVGIDEQGVRDILLAVAPIVGTSRILTALGNIRRALGLALELLEVEVEAELEEKRAAHLARTAFTHVCSWACRAVG